MVYNIGYINNIKITKEIRPYYRRWYNMISRCYNPKSINYKKYGGKGVIVAEDWLCFDNFYRDIKILDGWDEYKFLNGEIHLDKDKKVKDNKIYSKEYCQWLSKEENSLLGCQKQEKPIVAINKKKGIEIITTQRKVSREFNLTLTGVHRCLKGKQKQHKGWTFYYL